VDCGDGRRLPIYGGIALEGGTGEGEMIAGDVPSLRSMPLSDILFDQN
jgi:hypothetical protein